MSKHAISLSVLSLVLIFSMGVTDLKAQQDLEIGYVDPQAVLSKMPEMKAVQQKLQNFAERKREELRQREQNFQDSVAAYQQKSAVISNEARAREEERLGQLNADLQKYRQQIQQEVQQRQQELVGPLLKQIEDAINRVAERMNLTYVFNTTTSNGDVIILYASSEAQQKYDITDQVMQELGI